jgi:hypothetical protein
MHRKTKWHLSSREAASHCNGAIFHEISKDTISKIKYTALFQNLMKPSMKSSSVSYDYVKAVPVREIRGPGAKKFSGTRGERVNQFPDSKKKVKKFFRALIS